MCYKIYKCLIDTIWNLISYGFTHIGLVWSFINKFSMEPYWISISSCTLSTTSAEVTPSLLQNHDIHLLHGRSNKYVYLEQTLLYDYISTTNKSKWQNYFSEVHTNTRSNNFLKQNYMLHIFRSFCIHWGNKNC